MIKFLIKNNLICLTLSLFTLFFLFSNNLLSKELFDRKDLIKIAHESLNYVLSSAKDDKTFFADLTPVQKIVLDEMIKLLEEIEIQKFIKEHKVKSYKELNHASLYFYVDIDENIIELRVRKENFPELVFSNNRDEFKDLKPGEPERYMKTIENSFSAPIKVNVAKLNENVQYNFDLGSALALLVHEYGHKIKSEINKRLKQNLSPDQVQSEIDKLGEKVDEYIKPKISKFENINGITFYSLENLGFNHRKWSSSGNKLPSHENPHSTQHLKIVTNSDEFDSLPNRTKTLSLMSKQGFYIWSEFNGVTTDLTAEFKKRFILTQVPTDFRDQYYDFIPLYLLLPTKLSIMNSPDGSVNFKIDVAQINSEIDFMNGKSPNPKEVHFNKRYRWSILGNSITPYVFDMNARLSGPYIQFQTIKVNPRQITPSATLEVKLKTQTFENEDLLLTFEVNDPKSEIGILALTRNVFLYSAEIELQDEQNNAFYLEAEKFDGIQNKDDKTIRFSFRIKKINKKNGYLHVRHFYLHEKQPQDSINSEFRLEIPIFQPIEINLPNQNQQVELNSNQISLYSPKIEQIQFKNNYLTLEVDSQYILDHISINLDLEEFIYSLIQIDRDFETLYQKATNNYTVNRKISLNLNSNQFHSSLNPNNKLILKINLSHIFTAISSKILQTQKDQDNIKLTKILVRVLNKKKIKLNTISLINRQLQVKEISIQQYFDLSHALVYNNDIDHDTFEQLLPMKLADKLTIPTNKKLSCERLFNL